MLTHLLHKYLTLESCARCKRIKRRERERAHFLFTLLMCFSCFSLSPPLQKAPGGAGDRESGRGSQRAGQPDAEHSGRHWHLPLRWGAHQWEEVSEVAQETGETVEIQQQQPNQDRTAPGMISEVVIEESSVSEKRDRGIVSSSWRSACVTAAGACCSSSRSTAMQISSAARK